MVNKSLEYYMNLPYRMEIVEDKEEGGYTLSHPDLRGCVTCGKTIEEGIRLLTDAKRCWLEAALESGIDIPEPSTTEEYSGQFKLRLPKSLHRLLAERSSQEGISMNQYCVYLLSKGL